MAVGFAIPGKKELLALYKNEPISSSVATFTLDNIRQDYSDIILQLRLRSQRAGNADTVHMRFNNNTTGADYPYSYNSLANDLNDTFRSAGTALGGLIAGCPASAADANRVAIVEVVIPEYFEASRPKFCTFKSTYGLVSTLATDIVMLGLLWFTPSEAISKIVISTVAASNFAAGCTFSMYLRGKR